MKKTLLFAASLLLLTLTTNCQSDRQKLLDGIKSHSSAQHIKDGWIRDPFIVLAPDGYYYLTGTTPLENEEREKTDKYNNGLHETSIVGNQLRIWKSDNLVDWTYLGSPYSTKDNPVMQNKKDVDWTQQRLWAPELHWADGKWLLTHCPRPVSTLAVADGDLMGKWVVMTPKAFIGKHDPSLFKDDDGQWYMLSGGGEKYFIQPIAKDFSNYSDSAVRIAPSDRRLGHEGGTMLKIGGKYVYFGTAWSTDEGRKGSYNLYYCTSDNIYGPYSERRFMGRFLGHGTPFQDKNGKWWCTAFYNANVPPLSREGIQTRDLKEDAQTINQMGTTIVPIEVRTLEDGDVFVRAIDPDYRNPGPDEIEQFDFAK
ncbi:MAG: family 43 glycosylhydrolase [Bacteroidales bacterium]